VKALNGADDLGILPTGTGKTAAPTTLMLVLIRVKLNPEDFALHCGQFPHDPIAIVVYPTNRLEEERVCVHTSRGQVHLMN